MSAEISAFKPARFNNFTNPECATCSKVVYFAEKVSGPGSRIYHKMCLKCTGCGKRVEAGSFLEHETDPYCKNCHLRSFGPKGVGYGGALSGTGEYQDRLGGTPSPSQSPTRRLFPNASNSPSSSSTWNPPTVDEPLFDPAKSPVSARTGSPIMARTGSRDRQDSFNAARSARAESPTMSRERTLSSEGAVRPASPSRFSSASDQADKCRRCNTNVYFAERTLAAGQTWHKRCLRCAQCSKALDSHLCVVGDLPFCKKCQGEQTGLSAAGIMSRPNLF